MLMAAALMPPQPKPLSTVAANRCQGAVAAAQPQMPMRERQRGGLGHDRQAETAIEPGQVGATTAPTRKCTVTAAETSGQRPAARFADRMQKDGRAVEADAPAEDGEHEGAPYDAPSVERWVVWLSMSSRSLNSLGVIAADLPDGGARCYDGGRSIAAGAGLGCRPARQPGSPTMASNATFAESRRARRRSGSRRHAARADGRPGADGAGAGQAWPASRRRPPARISPA